MTQICSSAAADPCSWAQVSDEGPRREQRCRRIVSALLPAAELLLRTMGLRLEHGQCGSLEEMRIAADQARCTATRDLKVHEECVFEHASRDSESRVSLSAW